jgi:C-terminal processing protease CtpA/Prc
VTDWVAGVFRTSSTFEAQCETVRIGVDIEGNPFPDRAGSSLFEKHWLRAWTHETYLWNTEVIDTNPALTADRLTYFAALRTLEKTSSGKDKDSFHFSQPTTEFLAQRNSAASASYGIELVAISRTIPRDYRVEYVEPNSPAAALIGGKPALGRGAKILSINGVDLINGNTQSDIDALNAGLFPANAGTSTTFVVRDVGATSDRSVTLVSQNISAKAVNRTNVINTASGKVGYILFNTFSPNASEQELFDAMSAFQAQNVNDLVLDLRYNGGGLLAVASELSYMVAGSAQSSGKTFQLLRFNAASGNRNPVTGQANNPVPFYNAAVGFSVSSGTPLPALNLNRVYVLTTDQTCSASEAVINGLRGIGVNVVQIGGRTCGKPFGFYPTDNCGVTYYTIQFQTINALGFGDYADGFVPDNVTSNLGVKVPGCSVNDDLSTELGDPLEGMLATALSYRLSGVCPTAPVAVTRIQAAIRGDPATALDVPVVPIMRSNIDMSLPSERY